MICCIFSGGIIISSSSLVSFSLFFDLPNEVILSAILFPIKSPFASALFWTILLPAVLANSLPCFFVVSIIFYHIYWFLLLLQHPLISYHIYLQNFLQMTKSHNLIHIFYKLVQVNISFLY